MGNALGRPPARAALTESDINDGIIKSSHIATDTVVAADIAADAVGVSELSATGTASVDTYLRGDNSWAAAGSPSITDNGNANAMTIDSDEDVTFANRAIIPSLKPISNQNLTGTYADHEMIMGDQFTLTGDLTINDNLVLASLSGSGQDITITDDGNGRTITTAGKVLSCTTTNTDATVTTASTADLRAGKGVTGTGIPSGATIASITNATTFELSAAATASGTVNLTFDTAVFEAGEFLGTVPLPSLDDLTGTLQSGVTGSPAIHLDNTGGTVPAARFPPLTLKTFTHLETGWNGIGTGSWAMGYIWHNASNKWGSTGTGPTGATFTPSAGITKTWLVAKFKVIGYQTTSNMNNNQFSVQYDMYIRTSAIAAGTTYNADPIASAGTAINNKSVWSGRDDYYDMTGPSGSDSWHHNDITTIWPMTGLTPGTPYYVHIVFYNPGGSGTSSPTITMGWIESLTFFEYS